MGRVNIKIVNKKKDKIWKVKTHKYGIKILI
jgi:hypothetical protein